MTKVAVLVGSLRKESFNLKTAKVLADVAPEGVDFEFLEIGDLPFYNEDVEAAGAPESWKRLRAAVKAADAVLFVTPEYNRSVPAVLKNALDVASRPYGHNAFDGKPAAVVSVSIGPIAGFGANHHLRQSLTFVNLTVMAQPEVYIGNAGSLFDAEGKLTNASTREFLTKVAAAFAAFIDKHK